MPVLAPPDGQVREKALRNGWGGPDYETEPHFQNTVESQRWFDRLLAVVDASLERGNGIAWMLFFFACGIALYFGLPFEPSVIALIVALAAVLCVSIHYRDHRGLFVLVSLVSMIAGATSTAIHTNLKAAPQITAEWTGIVSGVIQSVERRSDGRQRVVLGQLEMEDLEADATPKRIRVSISANAPDLHVNDEVSLLARIGQAPEPVMPGAWNPRRDLFFQQIGGVGFSLGAPHSVDEPEQIAAPRAWLNEQVSRIRTSVAQRTYRALEGEKGKLAAALLVGMREGISEETYDALRHAGLAHLLAISGMHMALVTLSALAIMTALLSIGARQAASSRALLAVVGIAVAVAVAYLMLSGARTSSQRAFIMILISLVALANSRRALTMRAIAVAGFVVLLIEPVSLLSPGFQMSFAATFALVACYQSFIRSDRASMVSRRSMSSPYSVVFVPVRMLAAIALTSIIAGLATAPFAAYHFSHAAPLGLLGNLLALPVFSIIIMPAALLAVIAMPFSLEGLPLAIMGWGVDYILAAAAWVSAFDLADVPIRAITLTSLLLVVSAFVAAGLFIGRARLLAIVPLGFLVFTGVFEERPSLIINSTGQMAALYHPETSSTASYLDRTPGRANSFAFDRWKQRLGLRPEDTGSTSWSCDPLGCIAYLSKDVSVAFDTDLAGLAEDCAMADIIVTPLDTKGSCEAPVVLDGQLLRDGGAVALYSMPGRDNKFEVRRTFTGRFRPWEILAQR
ncbi:MAG: ComEC/Rec2 family competence protein [Pseudomonadota bacterium]